MNTLTTRALVMLLSVLILVMIGSQIYYRINDRHKTEEAVLCNINENLSFKGVVIRDESVVNFSGNGVFEYLYSDGSKVADGDSLAKVYPSEQDLINKRKADKYNKIADILERAQNPGTAQNVQPETLNSKINAEYKKLISASLQGNITAFAESEEDFFLQSCIYNIITRQSQNYADEIAALRSKAESCAAASRDIGEVEATASGYFVSYVDGYEKKLDVSKVDELNQSDIESIIKGENKTDNGSSAIGKMFEDYSCKIIGIIPNDKRVAEGNTVRLALGSDEKIYNVTVESVKPAADEEHSIIIMNCNRLDPDIVSSRVLSLELVFDNYKGIKVPRDAIRFKNGEKGVYVILGNDTTFKKIEVIYEGSDFVVSKNVSDETHLLLYDRILLEAVSSEDESANDKAS